MSQINVDIIAPQSAGIVNVNGATIGLSGQAVQLTSYSSFLASSGSTLIGFSVGVPTGIQNTLIGFQAGQNTTTAGGNVCVGAAAGTQMTSGGGNVAVGNQAGAGCTTGGNNTFVGSYTNGGLVTTGSNNTCLGNGASPATAATDNSVTLGNASISSLRCAVTSITSLSDARDKKEVEDLNVGLDFIDGLRPVKFVWDDRDEAGKHDIADFGFIAQDLKAAEEAVDMADILKLVYDENPEKLEASYGKLIPILVKAVQELSAEVKLLKSK